MTTGVTAVRQNAKEKSCHSSNFLGGNIPQTPKAHLLKFLGSDGYFACSIGEVSSATIQKYIENQG